MPPQSTTHGEHVQPPVSSSAARVAAGSVTRSSRWCAPTPSLISAAPLVSDPYHPVHIAPLHICRTNQRRCRLIYPLWHANIGYRLIASTRDGSAPDRLVVMLLWTCPAVSRFIPQRPWAKTVINHQTISVETKAMCRHRFQCSTTYTSHAGSMSSSKTVSDPTRLRLAFPFF